MPKPKRAKVPLELREAVYTLYYDRDQDIDDVLEFLQEQGYKLHKSTIFSYLRDEKIRRETLASTDEIRARLPDLLRGLEKDVSEHKVEAAKIWANLPEWERNTLKGYRVRKEFEQRATELAIKLQDTLATFDANKRVDTTPTDELERKLGLIADDE